MAKELMKVWGKGHQRMVDPGGFMADKHTDPLNLFNYGGTPAPSTDGTAEMPTADSQAVAAARRRKAAAMKNRGGRASTILAGEDLLGG